MNSPIVVVFNESTVLLEKDAFNLAWALDYQSRFQFGPLWRIDARVILMPKGARVPAGAWILHLLDSADQVGALGYHDEDGAAVPYARVFCKTAAENGGSASETASHELCEMLVDPHVCLSAARLPDRLFGLEVSDSCQGNPYDVGEPYGRKTGVIVADFCLPNWFDPRTPASEKTSYRGATSGPFTVAPQGYVGYLDLQNLAAGWQQKFGAQYKGPPPVDLDGRVARRAT